MESFRFTIQILHLLGGSFYTATLLVSHADVSRVTKH